MSGDIGATAAVPARFKPYPAYTASGVEWLGEVPAHWEVKRFRYVTSLNPPASEIRGMDEGMEVSFVPMEAVGEFGGLDLARTKRVEDIGPGYTYFRDGDVVVAKITPCFENGKGALASGLANGVAFGTTELHVLRPSVAITPSFLFYVTCSHAFRLLGEGDMYGAGGQKRVPEAFFRDLLHSVPPIEDQRAIADFLDRETARIDALVAKKERLIELLQERRTALISHAVTKGLDPSVPMRDSGVKWLGDVPEHWSVVRSRRLFGHRRRRARPTDVQLTASQVYGVIPQSTFMAREGRRVVQVVTGADILKRAEVDDFVMSMRSFQGGLEWSRYSGSVSSAYVVLVPSTDVWNPFFAYLLKSSRYVQALQSTSDLVRDGQALRFGNFAQVDLPVVPLDEQRAIAAHLDRETARIDTLTAKAREAIARLQELRSALISAAVTGKIDVREEVG